MEDEANGVVDGLGFGEGLVATLVGDDPEAGGEETCPEAVDCPESESGGAVGVGVGEGDDGWIDEGVEVWDLAAFAKFRFGRDSLNIIPKVTQKTSRGYRSSLFEVSGPESIK